MKNSGLAVIQQRHTTREVRNVVFDHRYTRPPVAELDIDSVDYVFTDNKKVHVYNIEVEAKGGSDPAVIQSLTGYVLKTYPDVLKLWNHSKLATGKFIERLLNQGQLERSIDTNHNDNLTGNGYEKVNNLIDAHNPTYK